MTAKKFLGDASIYFIGQMLNRGIAFFLLPIYTQFLTPGDYGVLSVASTLAMIFNVLGGFSLDAAIIVLYFKLSEKAFKKLLLRVWLLLLLLPLLYLTVLELTATFYGLNFFPEVPWNPYLRLAVWTAYFGIFPVFLLGLLRAKQQAFRYAIVNFVSFLLQTAFIIYFVVVLDGGAEGSLRGQVISGSIVAIISSLLILTIAKPLRLRDEKGNENLKTAIFLGAGYLPHFFSIWLLNVSDRWILGYFVPTSEIGIYSLAYTIAMLVQLAGISSISAYSPMYFKNADKPEFRSKLKQFLSGYMTLHTVSVLTVSLLSTEILRIITHPSFHQAAFYVPFIALGYWFFVAFYQLCLAVIENKKRTGLILFITVPAALVNVALNWIFIPKYGILAASINTLAAFFVMAVLALFVSGRLDKLPFSWLTIIKTSVIAAIAFWLGYQFLAVESIIFSILGKGILIMFAAFLMFTVSGFRIGDLKKLLKPG